MRTTIETPRRVWTVVDERKFRVDFDERGVAVRIVERKHLYRSVSAGGNVLINAPYWHRSHHALGRDGSLPRRIIAAAVRSHAS